MKFRKLVLGKLGTNCYIAGDREVAVIDPAADADKILEVIEKEGLILRKILLTHGHFDHTGALRELKEKTGVPIYLHEDDVCMIGNNEKNLSFMTGEKQETCDIDVVLHGGETIEIGTESISVMHTPGHSSGSVCYICSDCVFSGDLIFKGSIGRFDFGSYTDEMESINRLLNRLGDDIVICPGHGEITYVGYEKKYNPYVRN